MSVSDRILLIDDHFNMLAMARLKRDLYKAIICFFWVAPSTKMTLSKAIGGSCYGVDDIIQNDMNGGGEGSLWTGSKAMTQEPVRKFRLNA
jgi:hypothetical protein